MRRPARALITRAHGIDVSQVQHTIDWPTVARAGFCFAYVKATEGTGYRDPMFENHVNGARAAGLVVGAYHVLSPHGDPVAQAKNFALFAGSLNLELPPSLDFELPDPDSWGRTVDPKTLAPRCLQAAKTLLDMWREPVIYTYPYFAQQLPPGPELDELVAVFGLWIAAYPHEKTVPDDSEEPRLPKPWGGGWAFWQYSGDHGLVVPGVGAVADGDLYNGTEIELRAACAHTEPCPPIPIMPDFENGS